LRGTHEALTSWAPAAGVPHDGSQDELPEKLALGKEVRGPQCSNDSSKWMTGFRPRPEHHTPAEIVTLARIPRGELRMLSAVERAPLMSIGRPS
jgi:hypothetical protein